MLTEKEEQIYSQIVSSYPICKTFCRVPSRVVAKLRENGFKLKILDPLGIPDMEGGVYLHFISVEEKIF